MEPTFYATYFRHEDTHWWFRWRYELITRIRSHPKGRGVPAVALTALARSEDRTRALRAGFQMHVAKPVEPTELVIVITSIIRRLNSGEKT